MRRRTKNFKKNLRLWDSAAIIISIVIGVGIFRVPSEVARYLGAPKLMLFAWLVGGIIAGLGSLCYAELSASYPKTGGNYIYLRESYGSWAGFLFGWTELLAVRTGSIAAVAFIFAEYSQSFLSFDKAFVKSIAIMGILMLTIVNAFGLQYGKRVQNLFTIPKILCLTGIIFFALISQKGNISYLSYAPVNSGKGIFWLFGLSLIPILWTYGGWHENTFMAEETKNAKRTIPLALLSGISLVTVLYVSINFIYLYLVPPKEILNANLVAADLLQILAGGSGRKILEAFIIISSLGCINAMIMTGSRVTYAMGKDNAIFRYIGKIDGRYGTPIRALIINAFWSIILIMFGTFNELLFFTGILVWLFFALAVGGVFILRHKHPNIERPYKAWGYPFLPAVFVLICIALVFVTMISYPVQSFWGIIILVSGIPIFIISSKKIDVKNQST